LFVVFFLFWGGGRVSISFRSEWSEELPGSILLTSFGRNAHLTSCEFLHKLGASKRHEPPGLLVDASARRQYSLLGVMNATKIWYTAYHNIIILWFGAGAVVDRVFHKADLPDSTSVDTLDLDHLFLRPRTKIDSTLKPTPLLWPSSLTDIWQTVAAFLYQR